MRFTLRPSGKYLVNMAGISLAATAPSFLALSSNALAAEDPNSEARNDRILVVLQLSGGNDGISTVVPYGDDAYYKNRRATAIAKKDVLRIDDYAGLNPSLDRLHAIHGEGELAIIQGASYPNPNRLG